MNQISSNHRRWLMALFVIAICLQNSLLYAQPENPEKWDIFCSENSDKCQKIIQRCELRPERCNFIKHRAIKAHNRMKILCEQDKERCEEVKAKKAEFKQLCEEDIESCKTKRKEFHSKIREKRKQCRENPDDCPHFNERP